MRFRLRSLSVGWILVMVITPACGDGSTSTGPTATSAVPTTSNSVVPASPVVSTATSTPRRSTEVSLRLTPVLEGLDEPVAAAIVPGTSRAFVAERSGRVRVVDDWVLGDQPALDISHLVISAESEQGLVGIAVHPDFALNGRVYLSFTERASADLVVAEYRVSQPGGAAFDPGSRREILRVEQSGPAHQGGTLRFDREGLLWAGLGDGGFLDDDPTYSQDPVGHAQNPNSLQGSLIRIDIDRGSPYAVPPGNPFVNGGGAPEVWAYGLRNPWGFSFDEGLVLIADVGRGRWEEVNVVSLADGAGSNFGWSVMEGPECVERVSCDDTPFVAPALALPRPDLCAVIGGPVYRGHGIPEVVGHYFFADLCSGWVRSAPVEGDRLGQQIVRIDAADAVPQVTALFVGSAGEMYLLTLGGEILRIDARR